MSQRNSPLSDVQVAPATELLPTGSRGRALLVAVAALAPVAQLAWVLSIPAQPSDGMADSVAQVAEAPTWFEISIFTQTVFGLVAVVSALVVGAAVRAGSPRWGSVATVVAVIGGAVGWSTASGSAVLAGLELGLPDDQLLELSSAVDAQASGQLVLATFPLIPLGYLLLGIAGILAGRQGVVPLWAGVVLTASMPLVMVGGATNRVLFAVGWSAVVVGVAGLAAAWARQATVSSVSRSSR